jgi:hypothetical protein
MSRKMYLAGLIMALAASVLGHHFSAVALAKAPVPKLPRPVISLGQSLEEALDALNAAKARDFSANVGIFIGVPRDEDEPRYEYRWFILRDNTCLCILVRRENARAKPIVARLELGEKGEGYGGKLRWLEEQEKHQHVNRKEQEKHRYVNSLELP